MVKQHAIKLTILNNTVFPMIYHGMWFDSGRVADGFSWPKTIFTKENHTIMCNERDWAVSGCSGYVQYVMSGYIITIAFSNPSVGSNKVGVDLNPNGKAVWEKIGSNDYQDFSINFKLLTVPITVNCSCTGGIVNFANVEFNQLHFN